MFSLVLYITSLCSQFPRSLTTHHCSMPCSARQPLVARKGSDTLVAPAHALTRTHPSSVSLPLFLSRFVPCCNVGSFFFLSLNPHTLLPLPFGLPSMSLTLDTGDMTATQSTWRVCVVLLAGENVSDAY